MYLAHHELARNFIVIVIIVIIKYYYNHFCLLLPLSLLVSSLALLLSAAGSSTLDPGSWLGDIAAGSSGSATAQTTGQQLGRLLELHDCLSSMATEGKHIKPKKAADGPTQVSLVPQSGPVLNVSSTGVNCARV